MIFSTNLKKNSIIVKAKSKNQWDLIEEMLDHAIKNNYTKKEDREAIKNALFEREKSMSTGIGRGVAIPHCTTNSVDDIITVLAFSNGVDFKSIDNQPVRIIILLLVPREKLKQHIKTLAEIAKIMNNDELREKLISLKTPDSILKTIKNFEKIIK